MNDHNELIKDNNIITIRNLHLLRNLTIHETPKGNKKKEKDDRPGKNVDKSCSRMHAGNK